MLGINLSGAEFGKGDKYGWDYIYPSSKDLNFYAEKGLTLVRLPVKWERLQPTLGGELDKAELGRLSKFLDAAAKAGVEVIVDLHNYGRYDGKAIGSKSVSVGDFADFWSKLADAVGDKPAVMGYGLMNEPHGMPSRTAWPEAAQAATDAIRALGDTRTILVGGEHWSGAAVWQKSNPFLDVKDPLDKVVYEAHVYFDKDGSGTYKESYDDADAYANMGEKRIQSFVSWLEERGAKGFIGEFGVPPDDPRWQVVLDNFLGTLNKYGLSGTYWGAGPWFDGYEIGLLDKKGKPTASLGTLVKHAEASKGLGLDAPEAAASSGGGSAGDDVLIGGAGADVLAGGRGDDLYRVDHEGDRVVERVGEGRDRVHASLDWTLASSVDDLALEGLAVRGVGNALGNAITGNAAANRLEGLGGNDRLDGGAGADTLVGGDGNDVYRVDDARDTVVEGKDDGEDRVEATLDWTLGGNLEDLALIGSGRMRGTGNKGDNGLTGNDGDSVLHGLEGDDALAGAAGDDALYGGEGEDRLDGGTGGDRLVGGAGRDWLTGGAGRDEFAFLSTRDSTVQAKDRVLDFTQGEDVFDLSKIDASSKSGGDQGFRLIGEKAFTKRAGELRFEVRDDAVVVMGDVNGDGAADLSFMVMNLAYRPQASDFLF